MSTTPDPSHLPDGLYRVTTNLLCAGFVIEAGAVTHCAPILRKKLGYWMSVAERVPEPHLTHQPPPKGLPMSLLKSLTTDASIATEKDSVGSNRSPVESGLYLSTITLAYLTTAASGAIGLVLHAKTDGGREIQQTVYMTSGKEKGGTNFYTDKDGQKHYLPGFNLANSLALLTVGKEISELETETKVVKLYSKDAKAEVPTKVEMLVDLLDKQAILGVIKQVVDKTAKNEATGKYEATGETREENEIDKIFRAKDRMTTAEIRAQAESATFYDTWDAKWTGKTREKAKGAGAAGGTTGAPKAAAAASSKPKTSLFA